MNDEPPVDRDNWLHHALVGLHLITKIPSWVLIAVAIALAWCVTAAWQAATHTGLWPWIAGVANLAAVALDGAWLSSLPRRGISFGPVKPSLTGLIGVRLLIGLLPLGAYAAGLSAAGAVLCGILLHLLASGTIVYATQIEPFRLGVTHIQIETPKWPQRARVRVVQVSDLHVERITRREREVIAQVNALVPDYILLTGDYLNLSYIGEEKAIADTREILASLCPQKGTYAIRGTHQVDPNALLPILFEGLPIRWLRNEHVTIRHDGHPITLVGASCTRQRTIDVPALQRALAGVPADTFNVLLYHTPDLVPEAMAGGVDLYLSGHTHGGQIRLPFYGAMFTATEAGKKYEMGRYDVQSLTLYVSRGLGMEGMAAPRARFLCPPEIVCIDIVGTTL